MNQKLNPPLNNYPQTSVFFKNTTTVNPHCNEPRYDRENLAVHNCESFRDMQTLRLFCC